MKNFLTILRKIGSVSATALQIAAPFYPPLAGVSAIVNRVQNAIFTAEANNPADGQGPAKSLAVIADFEAWLEIAQDLAAARGKRVEYDKAALQQAITDFVSAYNGLAKVKASIREVDA